ncbi:hypothetical protein AAY473_022505 [Plecturocebus cupreus]
MKGPPHLKLQGSNNSPVSASHVAGIPDVSHHTWLIFPFLLEMRFHHVGQAGLDLLTLAYMTPLVVFKRKDKMGAVAHVCNPSTWEAKVGRSPEAVSIDCRMGTM